MSARSVKATHRSSAATEVTSAYLLRLISELRTTVEGLREELVKSQNQTERLHEDVLDLSDEVEELRGRTATSAEKRDSEIESIRKIQKLLTLFARIHAGNDMTGEEPTDALDLADWEELFIDWGRVIYPFGKHEGLLGVAEWARDKHDSLKRYQLSDTDFKIHFDPTDVMKAETEVRCVAANWPGKQSGRYHWTMRKRHSKWLIEEVRLSMFHEQDGVSDNAEDEEDQ